MKTFFKQNGKWYRQLKNQKINSSSLVFENDKYVSVDSGLIGTIPKDQKKYYNQTTEEDIQKQTKIYLVMIAIICMITGGIITGLVDNTGSYHGDLGDLWLILSLCTYAGWAIPIWLKSR